jgi:1,4-dihydroxy-2-naphthoate octaprenyltransferase
MSGECYDYDEDVISGILGRSKFAGGTGVLQTGIISRRQSFKASVAALISAGFIGLLLRYYYNTGPWTIPLGMIGMIGGFLYSTPPIRWAKTGIGELWIGLCFGFLPPVIGFYLPAGYFEPILFIIAIPIAATIFNVILANEYPDYIADRQTGKRNLLIRVGKEKGARIYVTASVIGWAGAIGSVLYGVPKVFILFYFVPFGLSVFLVREFLKGSWKDANRLELMCGLGILTNATTSLSFCLAYIVG